LLQALEEQNVNGDSSAQIQKKQDRNIVRVKFELY
jgi:hypothetical protein